MAIHNTADNSFKRIFDDHRLFVDFIKDFIHIDTLENVKPEDIQDITERFLPLFQESRDADTVKRINLKDNTPFFVIAVLEHQSKVNFRSCFKMLLYICMVLETWEREAEKERPGCSLLKNFKYPPVLPMIFYDGKDAWTAERNFLNRTYLNDILGKYIPKFEYELVNLNDYNIDDITKFGDALSFLLLIDKIRNSKGRTDKTEVPAEYLEKLMLQIPENMVKLIQDVTRIFLEKSGLEAEKAAAIVEKAGRKEYGGMFEAAIESIQEGKAEAWAEGKAEGRAEYQAETARNALAKGLSIELIQEITGVDREPSKGLELIPVFFRILQV